MTQVETIDGVMFDNPSFRRALGKKSLYWFARIYFPELFKFATPEFHREWYRLLTFMDPETQDLFVFLILCAFRDSAKTSLAKIKVVRDICYKRRRLIGYVCYEKEASGEALFDIFNWLTTKKRLINDFGNLIFGETLERRPEKRSVTNFVTTNGVRVTAYSIRQSVRGKTFDLERPDAYVIDDFENMVTKKSAVLTRKAINFIKELITGLSVGAEVIFVCNKISDTGSVQWLLDMAHENPQFRMQEVPVEIGGESVWPERYVLTDDEAKNINKAISNPKKHVKSLETEKRTMNADGEALYEQEMLLQPIVEGDRFFDVKKIDERIAYLKSTKWQSLLPAAPNYYKVEGDWKIWAHPSKKARNAIAADVAEGGGGDSSVIQIYDFTNNRHVAEYESDRCPPDVLGELMAEKGKEAGFALVCPERNSIGISTIDTLKRWQNRGYPNVFRQKTIDQINNRPVHKYGWRTGADTKPHMLFEFKRDFEKGLIQINSIPLLREMRGFTNRDLPYSRHDPEATNHFDRLMAFAILWQMRNVVQIKGFK